MTAYSSSCPAHPDDFNVFRTSGGYTDANGKQKQALRAGDAYARHGSKSEPYHRVHDTVQRRDRG